MVRTWFVYALIDPRKRKKGRVFYIGKGQGNRSQDHLRRALGGYHYNNKLSNKIRSIHKDGLEYGVEFLFSSTDETKVFEQEMFWISFYGLDTLCNLTSGGEGVSGYVWTPESIEKMRTRMADFKHSEETKQKISASHMGIRPTDETKEKLRLSKRKIHLSGKGGAKLVTVDGIEDTIKGTCRRIGIMVRVLSRWMKRGYEAQDIINQWRARPQGINRPLFPNPEASSFVGVHKHGSKFVVQIAGKYIGLYNSELDAAISYNAAALIRYGPKAYQNPIPN